MLISSSCKILNYPVHLALEAVIEPKFTVISMLKVKVHPVCVRVRTEYHFINFELLFPSFQLIIDLDSQAWNILAVDIVAFICDGSKKCVEA